MTITIITTEWEASIHKRETFDDVDALLTAVRRWNDNIPEPVETHHLYAAVLNAVSVSATWGSCASLPGDGGLEAVWGEGAYVRHPECAADDHCVHSCRL